jgi:hypothetical protein
MIKTNTKTAVYIATRLAAFSQTPRQRFVRAVVEQYSPKSRSDHCPDGCPISLAVARKRKTPPIIQSEGAICVPKSNIQAIVQDLRSAARKCAAAGRDCADEELADYLEEIRVILTALASTLEEFDQ